VDYEERVMQVEAARISEVDAAKISEVEAALDGKTASEREAGKLLVNLSKFVAKSKEIRSLTIEIDGQETEPDKPLTPFTPGGRMFRR
jgi:hypothetical protein